MDLTVLFQLVFTSFFLKKIQPITSAPDDISLSLDQDINQFLV